MSILRFVYAACDLLAIGAGTIVLFGLLTGELIDKWAALFLKYALATSVTGLLFPLHDFTLVQRCSMLSVYVTGMSVLAWRKFHLSGVWRSIFALTITIVLYLNVVVAIDQVFDQMPRFMGLAPTQSELTARVSRSEEVSQQGRPLIAFPHKWSRRQACVLRPNAFTSYSSHFLSQFRRC
jgi:hypothetical protein